MNDLLYNPVFSALSTRDQHLSFGSEDVKFFDESVSPFAGFRVNHVSGFMELHSLLPNDRMILYATPEHIDIPLQWKLLVKVEGVQMLYTGNGFNSTATQLSNIVPLNDSHIPEMVALATLTRPGPFGTGTIEFGHYYGIFENNKLVAMTGQRLHPGDYSEVSAVCTHPDHLGKGYATLLVEHQTALILEQGYKPFLHVRADNKRAIEIYERLGYIINRPMNFYFMRTI